MSEWLDDQGRALWSAIAVRVAAGVDAPWSAAERDAFALRLYAWQRARSAAIDRVANAFAPRGVAALADIPGVPTDAFKSTRIACFDAAHTTRTFRTSGTTREIRGKHVFADTSLYARAALETAARDLLPSPPYTMTLLAEPESEAPESSLSFMLARFSERFSIERDDPWALHHGRLDVDGVRMRIARASGPVALLGATFAFVHFLDATGDEIFGLPAGSVVMPTGGFKGRSRELAPDELFALLMSRLMIRREQIVQEYGMTELSSQAYERRVGTALRYVPPPWMSVFAVDPETLEVRRHGEPGLLKIVDLLNIGSCCAIQTADLGTTYADGFVVHGRAPGATPRGCARAIDALLSGGM